MQFSHLPTFEVTGKPSEEYGEWVDKTAKLLKRDYGQVHRLFTREKWSLDKIRERYLTVTKHNGVIPSHILWWHLRKKDMA